MSSRFAVITIAPIIAIVITAFLWVKPNQARFYSENTLLERASLARDDALFGSKCDEIKLATQVESPPGGVRLYVWNCLSRSEESREVLVKVLDDGKTQVVTNALSCRNDPDAAAKGYLCTPA
ncbi:MAG TPA: hypothetical protein VFT37_05695 [Telluria sp.]|nr:hypothetical protein [Telluria sp.]